MKSEQFEKFVNSNHEDCEVVFGYQSSAEMWQLGEKSSNILFHYNIARHLASYYSAKNMRLLSRIVPENLCSAVLSGVNKLWPANFHSDLENRSGAWYTLQQLDHTKKAIILVADRPTLLERVDGRDLVEPLWTDETSQYSRTLWRKIYEQADLLSLYQGWCDFLEAQNIPYRLVDSRMADYQPIENRERLSALLA